MFDLEVKILTIAYLAGSLVLILDMVFWRPF